MQLQGLLDDRFLYAGPLGAAIKPRGVDVVLWAPTARGVELLLYDGPRGGRAEVHAMREGDRGEWSCRVRSFAFEPELRGQL